jgi:two-component system, LytTR family, response regulator
MKEITTIIVDDEPLAREKLRLLLGRDPMFRIVQECGTGREAIQAVYAHTPQVAFIDVQMPDIDGFSALASIDPDTRPLVVLTTAYSHYAVQAFEAEVLDYLLKPFDEDRLSRCIRRIKSRLVHKPSSDGTAETLAISSDTIDRFLVKAEGRILFFEAEEIDWIEAASNYVEIHTGTQSFLVRHTMNELEKKLNRKQFLRIHRSYIVNVSKIRGVQPCNSGEYMVRLQNGKELPSSRGYRENLDSILKAAI